MLQYFFFFFSGQFVGGHLGRDKTLQKVADNYFWVGMKKDVSNFVKACDKCCRVNPVNIKTAPPLNPIPVPSKVWSLVGIDIVGPLTTTESGNKYIVALTDHFSKYSEAKAIPNKSAAEVAKFVLECICRYGPMDSLISDQGREFINEVIDYVTTALGIEHRISSPYHPQTNGQRERDNRTLKDMLVKTSNDKKDNWDEMLQSVLFAYKISIHASTKVSPFEVMFVRKPKLVRQDIPKSKSNATQASHEMLEQFDKSREYLNSKVTDNIVKAQCHQKKNYDKRYMGMNTHPKGTMVLIKNASKIRRFGCKLEPSWLGPYKVVEDCGKGRVRLENTSTGKKLSNVYHCTHLKLYTASVHSEQLPKLKTLKCVRRSVTSPPIIKEKLPAGETFSPISETNCRRMCSTLKINFKKKPGYKSEGPRNPSPIKLHRIKGDGNCLFRSLAYAVSGSEDSHMQVRDAVVQHMQEKGVGKLLTKYIGQNVKRYVNESRMESCGVWATDAEIMGAAHLLQVDIVVYSKTGEDKAGIQTFGWQRFPCSMRLCKVLASEQALYLNNLRNEHYDVVLEA